MAYSSGAYSYQVTSISDNKQTHRPTERLTDRFHQKQYLLAACIQVKITKKIQKDKKSMIHPSGKSHNYNTPQHNEHKSNYSSLMLRMLLTPTTDSRDCGS